MNRTLLLIGAATAAAWLTPALVAADPPAAPDEQQAIAEELKSQEDPTILKRRVWSDTEWNSYEGGSQDIEETLGTLWAWRVSDHQDWAVRLKVPFEFHVAGDDPADSDQQGLGDIKLGTGTAFRLGETWRTALGLEMRFPSATDDDLGDNVWQPQLLGTVAWDVTRQLTLSPSVEYNQSIAEEDGVNPQQFMEIYFPATYLLPQHWSVSARYEAKVDFENNDHWTHSAKFVLAKQLVRLPLGFSLSFKKPFDGGDKEFQLNFVTTYYFRSRPPKPPGAP